MIYACINGCKTPTGLDLEWFYMPEACPKCGGKIVEEKISKDKLDKMGKVGKMYFHKRWEAKHMQVGLDKVYCPTRQSYLDACKHGRVMHAGTREVSTRVIDPVGAKD